MDNVGGGSGCFLKLLLPGQKEFALWIEVAASHLDDMSPHPSAKSQASSV